MESNLVLLCITQMICPQIYLLTSIFSLTLVNARCRYFRYNTLVVRNAYFLAIAAESPIVDITVCVRVPVRLRLLFLFICFTSV